MPGSGIRAPGFEYKLQLLLAVCPWAHFFTPLCFNFFINQLYLFSPFYQAMG